MSDIDRILEFVSKFDIYDNASYKTLVSTLGKDQVCDIVFEILRNKDKYPSAYTKLINNSGKKCYMAVNDIFLRRLREVIDKLNELFLKLNVKNKKFNKMLIDDKVSYVNNGNFDFSVVDTVNGLYQEFVTIRNKICECNIGLVSKALKKYEGSDNYHVLHQEGLLTLLTSIEKYDSTRGTFSNFLYQNLLWRISDHLHDLDSCVYMPHDERKKYYELVSYYQENGEKEGKSFVETSIQLGVSLEEAILYSKIYAYNSPGDSLYHITEEHEPIIDTIASSRSIREVEEEVIDHDLVRELDMLIDRLPEKEKMVIRNIYYSDNSVTYRELADKLGLSVGGIGLIHKRALSLLGKHNL